MQYARALKKGVAVLISKTDTLKKMGWLTLWLTGLVIYCSSIHSTQAAVQKVPEVNFSPNHVTEFDYQSRTSVVAGVNITLSAQVNLQVIEEDDSEHSQKLLISVSNIDVSIDDNHGHSSRDKATHDQYPNLDGWFAVLRSKFGLVTSVYYDEDHYDHNSLNMKKAIAGMMSMYVLARESDYDHKEVTTRGDLLAHYTRSHSGSSLLYHVEGSIDNQRMTKHLQKVIEFGQDDNLKSITVVEDVMGHGSHKDRNDFIALSGIHSEATLRYISRQPSDAFPSPPQHIATNTLSMTQSVAYTPLTRDVKNDIERKIAACSQTLPANQNKCVQDLQVTIHHFSNEELESFVEEYAANNIKSPQQLTILFQVLCGGSSKKDLDIVIAKETLLELSSNVLNYVFSCMTSATPTSNTIEVLKTLAFDRNGHSTEDFNLSNKAMLALGAVAKKLGTTESSSEIVEKLHSALQEHTDVKSDGFSSPNHQQLRHAVLIDSIGNAAADNSLDTIIAHTNSPHSLTVKHSALRALSHYSNAKAAKALLDTALDSEAHHSLRHSAAHIYQQHSLKERDLTDVIEETSHHLSRHTRSVSTNTGSTANVYNMSAPGVGWSRRLGDRNISTELGNRQINDYMISTDPFSTVYEFSLHSSTWVETFLELSDDMNEQFEIVSTTLCYEGIVTYDENMLQNYHQNLSRDQYDLYSPLSENLSNGIQTSVDDLIASEANYDGMFGTLHTALSSLPEKLNTIRSTLSDYRVTIRDVPTDNSYRQSTDVLHSTISDVFTTVNGQALAAMQPISAAVNATLLNAPSRVTLAAQEVDVAALAFSPHQALNDIYRAYTGIVGAVSSLRQRVNTVQALVNPFSDDGLWVDPSNALDRASVDLNRLAEELSHLIEFKVGTDIGAERAIQRSVLNQLQPAIELLEELADDLIAAVEFLSSAYQQTDEKLKALTNNYEYAWFEVDAIFGQRFAPQFPNKLRPCDIVCNCGNYPSTTGGMFPDGIDLVVEPQQMIFAPFAGIVRPINSSDTVEANMHDIAKTIVLTLTDFNYQDLLLIITNVNPASFITEDGTQIFAGQQIGNVNSDVLCTNQAFIHVEAYKRLDGRLYAIDSSQFLASQYQPNIDVQLYCNDVTIMESGMVVSKQFIAGQDPALQLIDPPIVDIARNEFPQLRDYTVSDSLSFAPTGEVEYFSDSIFLSVGPIPVEFSFSARGSYNVEVMIDTGFLSKTLKSNVLQSSSASIQGYMRVGNALYAEVAVEGKLMEGSMLGRMEQHWQSWPLSAKSAMDLTLSPSLLSLTARLIRQTGAGAFADLEIIDAQNLWQYSVPPVHREEYSYTGITEDETVPSFSQLSYDSSASSPSCYVQQLPNRPYNCPAFEIEVSLQDCEDYLSVTFGVGTHIDGSDVFTTHTFTGQRLVVPDSLDTGRKLFVTVAATNSMGLTNIARCELATYDTSPPMARINPRALFSSHPSQLETLISLFDEYGLIDTYEIAVATYPGEYDNVLEWQLFDTNLIDTPPAIPLSNTSLFSAPRDGQLTGNIIRVIRDTVTVEECAISCNDNTICRSFDFSVEDSVCVLHSDIEGPATDTVVDYPNNFATPRLRASASFHHYEKLGVGNSTNHIFTNLSLASGNMYYINLRLQNGLGYSSIVTSSGIVVDFTPPDPGPIANPDSDTIRAEGCTASIVQQCIEPITTEPNHRIIIDGPGSATIFNGPTPLLDALYSGANNFIAVNWDGFRDYESGIRSYTWCVGNASATCNILDYQRIPLLLHSSQAWTNVGLFNMDNQILQDGPYYLSVQAINNAVYGGSLVTTVHHTTPYVIDTSPPLLEITMISYDSDSNRLTVQHAASDDGSNVSDVSVALGYTTHDVNLLQWTSVSTGGIDVYLPDGVYVYAKVRATNNVGLTTVADWPSSLIADRVPPAAGNVYDGEQTAVDVDYQSSTSRLCITFNGFHRAVEYTWGASITPGGSDVLSRALTATEIANKRACTDGLSLQTNMMYYSTITAENALGLTQTVTSDGVLVDATPPSMGMVYDGIEAGVDVQFSSDAFRVQASWNGFTDDDSGISHYTVSVYYRASAGTDYVLAYTEQVSNLTQAFTADQFTFDTGYQVLVELEGFNSAGQGTAVNTTGVTIDLTAPVVTRLNNGANTAADASDEMYQDDANTYRLNWNAMDPDSGIVRIEAALYDISEGRRVLVYPNASTSFQVVLSDSLTPTTPVWTVNDLNLTSGHRYVGRLIFTNGAGLQFQSDTSGIIVDVNPPELQRVEVLGTSTDPNVGIAAVTSTDVIEGRWRATDRETAGIRYRAGIKDTTGVYYSAGGDELVDFGYSEGGVLSGLTPALTVGNAMSGPFYQLEVIAIDQSGMSSERMVSDNFYVTMGNTAGNVRDGEDPTIDIDYTDEVTMISAHFDGFSSQSCGGIVRYEWAVGIDGVGKETVFEFTDKGLIFSYDGSGKAQHLLPGLSEYGSQLLYTTVRAITGCGIILESSSDGFIIDPTSPELDIIAVGANAIELGLASELGGNIPDHQPYQTEKLLSATWTSRDTESDLQTERVVKVGSYPGGADIIEEMSINDNYVRGLEMSDDAGQPNYVTVSIWNRAGVRKDVTAPAVAWDQTPPQQGEVMCDTFIPVNWSIPTQLVQSSISCLWSGFYDAESGIDFYHIMIGTEPGEGTLHTAFVISESDSYSSPMLQFEHDIQYYITFRVSNRAGIQTNIVQGPIVVVTYAPTAVGSVTVIPNYQQFIMTGGSFEQVMQNTSTQCLFDSSILTVLWSSFTDLQSGIDEYQIAVGYLSGSDEILSYQDIQPLVTRYGSLMYELSPVYFTTISREPVYVSVRGYNHAGYYTTISSNEVYIVSEENTNTSWVYDGSDPQMDVEYQVSTNRIECTFSTGINCPIESIRWAVEAADGLRVLNFTAVEISDSVYNGSYFLSTRDVSLYNDETYRVLVEAVDRSGRIHLLKSNGVTVTTKPLYPGFVEDGPISTHDLNYQESLTTLNGHWSNFGDGSPEQEIAYYEVAVGSDRDYPNTRTNIAPFTNVGSNTTHTFTDLDLAPLTQRYYITVRAYAVSGAYVDATSNGIYAGLGHTVIPGTISVLLYQSNNTVIQTYWSKFESDFPIRLYSWAIGSTQLSNEELSIFCNDMVSNYNNSFDVFDLTDVGTNTEAVAENLNLTQGVSYYVTVRAIDDAKKCIMHQSQPVVIDTTLPVAHNIYVGPQESRTNVSDGDPYITYIVKDSDIHVNWNEFTDAESGIERYEVTLFQDIQCGSTDVENTNNSFVALNETSYVFRGHELRTNIFIQVKGYNKAGLYTVLNSQPVIADDYLPVAGTVMDGLAWEDDLTYQNDTSYLSAVFSHSLLQPDQETDNPCPLALNFSLASNNSAWTTFQPSRFIGLDESSINYQTDQVTFSTAPDLPGTVITASATSQVDHIITGAYQTSNVQLSNDGRVSVGIRAALHSSPVSRELKENIVTSIIFIDSDDNDAIIEYDTNLGDAGTEFKAVGLQIHQSYANSSGFVYPSRLMIWSRQNDILTSTKHGNVDIHIDLELTHQFEFQFKSEQIDTYKSNMVALYVDRIKMAMLEGIPEFSDNTKMVLHLFNKNGYTPLVVNPSDIPEVEAVYSDVRLPMSSDSPCQYGEPFYDWGSPIVEFQVGIGSTIGLVNIQEFQTLSYPCKPCIPGPCEDYACEPLCNDTDPYLIPFTLSNLTLVPGYYTNQSDDFTSDLLNTGYSLSSFFSNRFQPAVYYVAVKAITASGQEVIGFSNGVTIDTTPPEQSSPIEHFDVEFSATQPTEFQGNNHTISTRWQFTDLESGIINYEWAIGSYPSGDDIQGFVSVGLDTSASNASLEGYLVHNGTYYVSVRATNGALLVKEATSTGITYVATELNATELELIVKPSFVGTFQYPGFNDSDMAVFILRTRQIYQAEISWENVSADVSQIFWRLGSDIGLEDLFPATEVSFNRAESARIDRRTLYLNDAPFASLSEIFALADGVDEDTATDELAVEPGRFFYHTLEFCSFAHKCLDVETRPSIAIREKDVLRTSAIGDDIIISIIQFRSSGNIVPVVDKRYEATFRTTGGIRINGTLIAGFLNSTDLRLDYRATVPYISNPFVTMGQTSVEVARRFTSFGGPSLYVSFLGMETLLGPLSINVTFDRNLDWSHSEPQLLYWDNSNELWRELNATCSSSLRIDWISFTLATEICSTIVDDVEDGSGGSGGRSRRQGFQDGLERPVQLIVARIGNTSINTAPSLVALDAPLQVNEGDVLQYQLEYIDNENDIVDFYLTSLPQFGYANITNDGLLTYVPCTDCIGNDTIGLFILERPFGVNIRMEAVGTVQVQVNNINDPPEIFFYDDIDSNLVNDNTTFMAYIEANRTGYVSVAQIGAWDLDGYEDDLSVHVSSPQFGQAQVVIWLDIVTAAESLPVNWSQLPSSSGEVYKGYVVFVGVNITYLPDNPDDVLTDEFGVFIRDSSRSASTVLTVQVEVLPSLCQNNGVCNGSIEDPDCTNITARRTNIIDYICSCPIGFVGQYCEIQTETPLTIVPTRACPVGVPMVQCDGNPCDGATCPSHPEATCTPNYCGSCRPQWSIGDTEILCHANFSDFCSRPVNDTVDCIATACSCPQQQILCPSDSILVETRTSDCCVQYSCECPDISCPLLVESGTGSLPLPLYRGNKFPGRCCPNYNYEDINECGERNGLCSDICINEDYSYQCGCAPGRTLSDDGLNCGVCYQNGQQFLFGDRVKVGCNWCICMGDYASPERWHCTLHSCEPTCQYNGYQYNIGGTVNQGENICTCVPTDVAAMWECTLDVNTE